MFLARHISSSTDQSYPNICAYYLESIEEKRESLAFEGLVNHVFCLQTLLFSQS